MNDKSLIIIGGGPSIKEGIDKGLWDKLSGKLTFGCNYSFNYFKATAQVYVDSKFYNTEKDNMKDLPLILGQRHGQIKKVMDNTILFNCTSEYDQSLKKGVYKASLCGLFALSLAIFLNPKDIYLLGYDYGTNGKKQGDRYVTHFYQGDIKHGGIGKIGYYNTIGRAGRDYKPFIGLNDIYNVSLISAIPSFPKITYDQFFNRLDSEVYDQDVLRAEIKEAVKEVRFN